MDETWRWCDREMTLDHFWATAMLCDDGGRRLSFFGAVSDRGVVCTQAYRYSSVVAALIGGA